MHNASPSCQLALCAHVRACEIDGTVVLLDLRRNRYVGVGGAAARSLVDQVDGWPALPDGMSTASPELCSKVALQLLSQGLLSDLPALRAKEVLIEDPTATLHTPCGPRGADIGLRQVRRFLLSAGLAHWWMHCRSLDAIATAVAARRKRRTKNASEAMDAMSAAIETYQRLRPLVFTARDKCLYDSLALVTFLTTEGLPARWVIGVRTHPFGAHAWVQSGHTVLNDHHEHVGQFRPILVV